MTGGGLYNQFNEHENIHFHNEYYIHTSFENYEANGHRHDPDLHPSHTKCMFQILQKSGCREGKSIQLTHVVYQAV
jgi:hypothetical protein